MVRNSDVNPDSRRCSQQDADFLAGIVATLAWVLGEPQAPVTHRRPPELATRDLKAELVLAEGVIEQARNPGTVGQLPSCSYGEGVKFSITWLPATGPRSRSIHAGGGPYGPGQRAPLNAPRSPKPGNMVTPDGSRNISAPEYL